MEELRVPTIPISAELVLADGQVVKGQFFLAAISSHHDGPPHPGEWFNSPTNFFPFLPTDKASTVILNKDQIVSALVTVEGEEHVADIRRRVVAESLHLNAEGIVYIDMPAHQSRLLDYMNRPERFIGLYEGNRCRLMHKQYITRIYEVTE